MRACWMRLSVHPTSVNETRSGLKEYANECIQHLHISHHKQSPVNILTSSGVSDETEREREQQNQINKTIAH